MKQVATLVVIGVLLSLASSSVAAKQEEMLHRVVQDTTGEGAVRTGFTPASTPLGIDVSQFGAVPGTVEGVGPQFQEAINYACAHGNALIVPAGVYKINQTLVVPLGGYGLRMVGAGKYLTTLMASSEGPMHAVLNVSWSGITKENTNIQLSQLQLAAAGVADYGLDAQGLTRSYFDNVYFTGALKSGCRHGGWIDVFDQCSFNGNHKAGLELSEENNNVVVRASSFEANPGHGIVILGGSQVTLQNNVIEGNGKTGVFANAVLGLSIRSNYFEFNQEPGPTTYQFGVAGRMENITLFADIVLNGAGDPFSELSGAYMNSGVELSGNTFCPHGPQRTDQSIPITGIVLAGVQDAVITNNRMSCQTANTSLFLTDSSPYWRAMYITAHSNSISGQMEGNYPSGFALTNPLRQFGSAQFHTWDFGPLFTTKLRGFTGFPAGISMHVPATGGDPSNVTIETSGSVYYYGTPVNRVTVAAGTSDTGVFGTYITCPSGPSLENVPVYAFLRIRQLTPRAVVSIALNNGKDGWQFSSDWYGTTLNEWMDISYQTVLKACSNSDNQLYGFGIRLQPDANLQNATVVEIVVGNSGILPVGDPHW